MSSITNTILGGNDQRRDENFHHVENSKRKDGECFHINPKLPICKDEKDSIMRQFEMFRRGETTFERIKLNTWNPKRGRRLTQDEILNVFLEREAAKQAAAERNTEIRHQNAMASIRRGYTAELRRTA